MTISTGDKTLKFKSGKEIILTEEEYNELKLHLTQRETLYYPPNVRGIPEITSSAFTLY